MQNIKEFYTWIGTKFGFQVSNYDGTGTFGSVVSSDGPCTHYRDIKKTFINNYFTEDENKLILQKAHENFDIRKNSTNNPYEYDFQIINMNDSKKYSCDFLIPLNLSCDSAALGLDLVFSCMEEWLEETI